MSKIKILSFEEAQKIAAGEVVERPANVLKELLENALDSGARAVTIRIEQAGKKLISVEDDGCGMPLEDIKASVLPHATSKINSIRDLERIQTYGFRGEALASIAAVTALRITSKEREAQAGWACDFMAGRCVREEPTACNEGTIVAAAELFHNIPVRKKFLKQDETEWFQIKQLVDAFAISHHDLQVKLYHDGKMVLNAPPARDLLGRLAQVWDHNAPQQFLPLVQPSSEETVGWLKIEGLISQPQYWRYNRQQMLFFVNNRLVRDGELAKHFIKGYNNVLPVGKFPAGCIFLTVDPTVVDVNVHPKKEEVRFHKPLAVARALSDLVEATLRQQVQKKITLTPVIARATLPQPTGAELPSGMLEEEAAPAPAQLRALVADGSEPAAEKLPKWQQRVPVFQALGSDVFASSARLTTPPKAFEQAEVFERIPGDVSLGFGGVIVGQLFSTYILIDRGSELVVVDQHAAHERVLYESMAQQVAKRDGSMLLFPQVLKLTPSYLASILAYQEVFTNFGFDFDQCGPEELAIKAVPTGLQTSDLHDAFFMAAEQITQHARLDQENLRKFLHEHMHSHLACKRAVKAGDLLTREQMEQLLRNLAATEKPFICVHGRPTLWRMPREQMAKNFQRPAKF